MERNGAAPLVADSGRLNEPPGDAARPLVAERDFSLLIVDDSPAFRQEIRALLQRLDAVGNVQEAENGVVAYKKALSSPPDLILCDLVMPSVDGLKFLTLVRGKPELHDIPVILLTGKTDTETKIRGLELGASDYVTKPFDRGELLARIKVQLKIKALQDALRRSNERLKELSATDALTQLFNRRHLMQALTAELERSERHGADLAFVMIDIDRFKRINDSFGHQAGDDVLRDLGARIRQEARLSDVPARYGGEEFCVLLPQTPLEGAREFAQRFRVSVESTPFLAQGHEIRLTVSVGVSACSGGAGVSGDDLIRAADAALYQAKSTGRNRVVVREP